MVADVLSGGHRRRVTPLAIPPGYTWRKAIAALSYSPWDRCVAVQRLQKCARAKQSVTDTKIATPEPGTSHPLGPARASGYTCSGAIRERVRGPGWLRLSPAFPRSRRARSRRDVPNSRVFGTVDAQRPFCCRTRSSWCPGGWVFGTAKSHRATEGERAPAWCRLPGPQPLILPLAYPAGSALYSRSAL